jgi:hypothetical protein
MVPPEFAMSFNLDDVGGSSRSLYSFSGFPLPSISVVVFSSTIVMVLGTVEAVIFWIDHVRVGTDLWRGLDGGGGSAAAPAEDGPASLRCFSHATGRSRVLPSPRIANGERSALSRAPRAGRHPAVHVGARMTVCAKRACRICAIGLGLCHLSANPCWRQCWTLHRPCTECISGPP